MYDKVVCYTPCPPAGHDEGEGDCYPDYADLYNAGCNSTPPVFTTTPCRPEGEPVTVCGLAGGFSYQGLDYRDTDWYEIPADHNPAGMTICLEAEYAYSAFYLLEQDCDDIQIVDGGIYSCVEQPCLELPPNHGYWVFVAVNDYGPSVGCGWKYNLTITGSVCPAVSVEPATWGGVKERYR
jgi:hypothetical protein